MSTNTAKLFRIQKVEHKGNAPEVGGVAYGAIDISARNEDIRSPMSEPDPCGGGGDMTPDNPMWAPAGGEALVQQV